MNDRIRQLATQLGVVRKNNEYCFSETLLEDFSKLLIQEYQREVKEQKREDRRRSGYSRVGLKNV